ncbi:MAG: L,D-transpeptidase family protein [Bacteroidetes bacterium]|nr:L,D-transpeptidase family protein [Bacteroidota bacterium]
MAIILLSLSFEGCEPDRAEAARTEKLAKLNAALADKGIEVHEAFELFFRAFKKEKSLEVWVKKLTEDQFNLLKTYPICAISGVLGPKRKEGDRQVPEGVYQINRFNPKSKFYLSLGLNYPNEADIIRAKDDPPGGDIFIHGGCASIGCLAMTDDLIKEIYLLAEMARDAGQTQIPVHIFPTKMTDSNMKVLLTEMPEHEDFWGKLAPIFQTFEENKRLFD